MHRAAAHDLSPCVRSTRFVILFGEPGVRAPAVARLGDLVLADCVAHLCGDVGHELIRYELGPGRLETFIAFRRGLDEDAERDGRFVKEALGIDPDIDELRLVYGLVRRRPGEIALLTRSMQELMGEMSAGIDVPEQDLLDGRATQRPRSIAGASDARLVYIRSSDEHRDMPEIY